MDDEPYCITGCGNPAIDEYPNGMNEGTPVVDLMCDTCLNHARSLT